MSSDRRRLSSARPGPVILGVALAALACFPACSHITGGGQSTPVTQVTSDGVYQQVHKLAEVMLLVRRHYVEDRDYTNIVDGAIDGMLQSLDEHSHYMPPEQVKELQETTSGQYGGIGLLVGMRDSQLVVIAPIEDTPAYRAGLLAQDTIIRIDGETTAGISIRDAIKKMRGQPATKVSVTVVRRNESEPRTFEITRDNINVPTVKAARMLSNGIGYVRVTQFAEPTALALRNEIEKLRAQGMDSLVLDLRSNPGGLLKSARDVAQLFLKRGALIVSIRDRGGKAREKRLVSEGSWHDTDTLMVVLIDGGSASASEIVAGALQDQKRAALLGDRSFGKGSVQTVVPLATAPDSSIRLTTAKYYTPSERVIHKHGIEPDIRVRVTPEEWGKILTRRAIEEQPANFSDQEKKEYSGVIDAPLERAADLLQALRVLRARAATGPAPVAAAVTNTPEAAETPLSDPIDFIDEE
ncbi:MAG: S41 family peptidase [bacterium]